MAFDVFDVSVQLVSALVEPLARITTHDPALALQLRRAASSVPLNVAEGRRRCGRDRLHLWRVAAGSAAEVVAALKVAQAWGYVAPEQAGPALGFCDRVLAMLWRLTHR